MSDQQLTTRVTADGSRVGRAIAFELVSGSPTRPTSKQRLSATARSPPPAATRARSCSRTCACS